MASPAHLKRFRDDTRAWLEENCPASMRTRMVPGEEVNGGSKRRSTNPDAYLMGVAVAASCAFLTPIGHKNNTLIMGPGGYQFGDYWRMGLPLEILIVVVSVPMILTVWPF